MRLSGLLGILIAGCAGNAQTPERSAEGSVGRDELVNSDAVPTGAFGGAALDNSVLDGDEIVIAPTQEDVPPLEPPEPPHCEHGAFDASYDACVAPLACQKGDELAADGETCLRETLQYVCPPGVDGRIEDDRCVIAEYTEETGRGVCLSPHHLVETPSGPRCRTPILNGDGYERDQPLLATVCGQRQQLPWPEDARPVAGRQFFGNVRVEGDCRIRPGFISVYQNEGLGNGNRVTIFWYDGVLRHELPAWQSKEYPVSCPEGMTPIEEGAALCI